MAGGTGRVRDGRHQSPLGPAQPVLETGSRAQMARRWSLGSSQRTCEGRVQAPCPTVDPQSRHPRHISTSNWVRGHNRCPIKMRWLQTQHCNSAKEPQHRTFQNKGAVGATLTSSGTRVGCGTCAAFWSCGCPAGQRLSLPFLTQPCGRSRPGLQALGAKGEGSPLSGGHREGRQNPESTSPDLESRPPGRGLGPARRWLLGPGHHCRALGSPRLRSARRLCSVVWTATCARTTPHMGLGTL